MAYKYLKNILRVIFSFKAILILRLLFGYYSELFSSKLLCKLTRIYCFSYFVVILTNSLWSFYYGTYRFVQFSYPLVLEFLVVLIISMYTKEEAFIKFCTNMNTIDKIIGYRSNFNVSRTSIFMCFCFALKYLTEITVIGYFFKSKPAPFPYLIVQLNTVTNYLSHVTRIATFELFWSRIKHITKDLKIKSYNDNLCDDDKIFILKRFLHHYKNILDNFSNTNKFLKLGLFANLIFTFIQIIICINYGIVIFIYEQSIDMAISMGIEIVISVALTISSAVLAEMLLCEYDQIQEICGNLLLVYTDEKLREMIYDTIAYIKTRPPKYTIWRIFPTDISVAIGLVELSATYVIVLLQF